ncbi:MAG: 5'-nucleotidase C-terminal domain-containing protein [Cyclonatronaceae bacterium]
MPSRIKRSGLLIPLCLMAGLLMASGACEYPVEQHAMDTLAAGDTVSLAVMATSDVHGRVRAWDYYRDREDPAYALSKVATLVDSIRSVHEHHLLLDAGDFLQGNPFAEYFALHDPRQRHYPFLQVADHMNYDAIVLGNHEFNFGLDYLNRQIGQTRTPVLGANVYHHDTERPAYPPYIVVDRAGMRIAVVGVTTPGSAVWDRPRVEGVLDFGDGVEAARRFVSEVREEHGAELVIILAHTGLDGSTSYHVDEVGEENFGRAIAEQVPGADLVVLGHTHRAIDDMVLEGADGRNVGVIQPGRWASHLGMAGLKVTREADGNISVADMYTRNLPVEGVDEHPEIVELIREAHQAVVDFVTEPVAHTEDHWTAEESRRKDTPIIDLIQTVQKEETGAQLSVASAFNTSVEFGPGAISRGDIALLYPYFNTLYKLEITGGQIRQFLEYTSRYYLSETDEQGRPVTNSGWPGFNFDLLAGMEYVLDLSNEPGDRLTTLRYEGQPVSDEDRFTIAVNSYRAEGGGSFDMLEDATVLMEIDRSVGDMILDYLQDKEQIRHEDVFFENWHLVY